MEFRLFRIFRWKFVLKYVLKFVGMNLARDPDQAELGRKR